MAFLDRRIVFAIALTAACSSPDFAASDADAGAGAMTSGNAGASPRHTSGGTAGTTSTGGAAGSAAGRPSATGGTATRGGSSGSGDTGGSSDAGEAATGGTNVSSGGSSTTGGSTGTGGSGSGASGGSDGGGTGGSGGGGTDSTGGTGGSNQGGSGGDLSPAGMGGGGTGGSAGSGMAGGGVAGLGTGGLGSGAGTGGSGEVIGGCDNQLLANASFEEGPSSTWREETTWPGLEIIVDRNNAALQAEGVAPYAGNYLAWLGGIPDNEWDHHLVILRQDVTLPADAATLTLSGRRYVKSVDDSSEVFDVAYLEFDNEAEDVVWQAQAWTNQSTTSGWVAFESSTTVATALRGKKLTFVAYSNTDLDGKTSFFLDELRLEASCGR